MSLKMHAVMCAAVGSLAVIVLTACGSNPTTPQTAAPAATTPASTATAPASELVPPGVATGEGSFTMPNEVGQVLQDAQDDIQRVSGNPLFRTDSTDLTGAGRMQVLDRNWQVCTQNIAPGTRVGLDVKIDFGVVKLEETCP